MIKLLFLFSLFFLASADHHHKGKGMMKKMYKKVPECKKLIETYGYAVPNCDAVGDCFEVAHKEARKCVALETAEWHKNPKSKACHQANRKHLKKWFGSSCQWHLAIAKCMDNADVTEEFEVTETPAHDHKVADHEGPHTEMMTQKECWDGVHTKTKECTKKAEENCDNYKYCDGAQDAPAEDERLKKWNNVVRHYKYEKHMKTLDMNKNLKKCMAENTEDPEMFFF